MGKAHSDYIYWSEGKDNLTKSQILNTCEKV